MTSRQPLLRNRKATELQYRGEILFGIHSIHLALLERRRKFHCLFVRKTSSLDDNENALRRHKIIGIAEHMKIPIKFVDNEGLKYLAPNAVHQGICLDVGPLPLLKWEECRLSDQVSEDSLHLVINEILDPMNVGAIIRSAYYFGVRELFMTIGNSCRLSPTVSKASSGSLEVMNIYHVDNLENFIKTRKSHGWSVFSTVAYCENKDCIQTTSDFNKSQESGPKILILGNEGKGISPEIQQLCDGFISIQPKNSLHEGIDSLNVSVAAGIILYSLTIGRCLEMK
ncbi:rRNA methyltransferase 1, mitochondrial-like [Uloborus diversus]|uniref:rRNA methyltransferase 1, mitochondrial-like n=1 Tax=Uloborus diversus TaxID=327109 RepID=UPI00240A97BC|nr:rRNA methyltransferase 1, mitochondrial-like [Uloborus diversus]